MKIILNGAAAEIRSTRLDLALAELGYADALIATALNEEFVPRAERAVTKLSDGDRLEVLAPLKGG